MFESILNSILSARTYRKLGQIVLDVSVSLVSTLLLIILYFSYLPLFSALLLMFSVCAVRMVGNYFFGSYRQLWRYTSLREIQNLGLNTMLTALVFSMAFWLHLSPFTLSAVLLDAIFYFVMAGGIRSVRRLQTQSRSKKAVSSVAIAKRTLLIGAGNAANLLLADLVSTQTPIVIVGLLDDDPAKQNAELHGYPILGKTADMERLIQEHQVQQVVISMPSASDAVRHALLYRARKAGVSVKSAANVHGILSGRDRLQYTPFLMDDLTHAKEFQDHDFNRLKENRERHILVTGGAGYIGNHLVSMLLNAGYRVRILDNLTYGDKGLTRLERHPNLELIKGDIANIRDVVRCVKDVDTVIALAALVGDPACGLNAEETLNLNYEATKILVEASNFYGVKRFVFASSCSVYGASPDDTLLTEDSVLNPVSLYAKTRIMSEEVVIDRSSRMEPVILRLSTVFGYSDRMRYDLVVNTLTVRGVVNKAFQVFGGNQWRPFIHCRDVAKAFYLAATVSSDKVTQIIFNVGSNDMNFTISDVAKLIEKKLPDATVEYQDSSDDPRNYRVNFNRIRESFGFVPDFSIEQGVDEMIDKIQQEESLREFSNPIYSNVGQLKNRFSEAKEVAI